MAYCNRWSTGPYDAAARFHAQPLASKLALKVDEHNIGYLPISDEASPQAAAQDRKPSQNEAYFLRRERTPEDPAVIANRRFHGLNQWPNDLPGFRETALEYMRTLEGLCRRLLPLYALALGLPAYFFDACFAEPHMILRMSRYPIIDGEDESVASLVPHTDSGFMTLLPPNRVPGLSILLPRGRWIDAPGIDGAYVVNGGDILHRWTNERFLSTPHRVRNVSGQVRYAIPFFCDPDHDTVIECLPTCRSADNPEKYPPTRLGDYALWFASKSYQHMANEPVLPDAVVAPGARATARWWMRRFGLENPWSGYSPRALHLRPGHIESEVHLLRHDGKAVGADFMHGRKAGPHNSTIWLL
jgi:isopenicillin N synthase-like dioxygenase